MKWLAKYPDYALTFPLAILCLALGVGLAAELLLLQRPDRGQPAPAVGSSISEPDPAADSEEAFELPSVEEFSDFVEKPLFVEGRKPPPEDEQKQAAQAQDTTPLNLKLMGVMFSPSGEMAILAEASGKNRRIRKGGSISGWRLVDLKTDRVTLQRGDERQDLPLLKPKPKTATAAPPPGRPRGPVPGGPLGRGAQPPPDVPEPDPDDLDASGEGGDPAAEEDMNEAGDEMPEGEE
ncbi:type II secretion system protein N [Methylotetracoccus oryzae]|uniref:type II secretion system protein N n=1 Tax=Methylotetracoccus oryzae TaxID=1919059 RepID=UPI00111945D7|nr:type II secretion system protein N [Methylotetracoccus oryzae]